MSLPNMTSTARPRLVVRLMASLRSFKEKDRLLGFAGVDHRFDINEFPTFVAQLVDLPRQSGILDDARPLMLKGQVLPLGGA